MFIEISDYKTVCGQRELDVITQSDPQTRQRAERVAMEEVAGYLRPRYDVEKAFAAEGEARSPILVQRTVDVALYYLVHWLPQKLALEGRQELYDDAVEWLIRVSKGTVMPDLPTYTGQDGQTDTSNPMRFGSMEPNIYDY